MKDSIKTGDFLLAIFGLLFGFVVSEIGFRFYLQSTQPEAFKPSTSEIPSYGVYDQSHWEFSEEFGYQYPSNRKINLTSIEGGKIVSCSTIDAINEFGNIGRIEGVYQDSKRKIAVFGDSFTVFHHEGINWPLVMQRNLIAELGETVHVLNFARDGYGVLQMLDLAAANVEKWNPDLVIIAFITDDLTRARSWRTVVEMDGITRVLTTDEPKKVPDPARSTDTFLLDGRATPEWCMAQKGKSGDPVVAELDGRYRKLREENMGRKMVKMPSLTDLSGSYILSFLLHQNPFHHLRAPQSFNGLPRHAWTQFDQDPRFVAAVNKLRASGKPILLVHLATSDEIAAGHEHGSRADVLSLMASLENLFGQKILKTTNFIQMPMPEPTRINNTPTDTHPSKFGVDFYARVVTDMVKHQGVFHD